jgi:hypothetical protein
MSRKHVRKEYYTDSTRTARSMNEEEFFLNTRLFQVLLDNFDKLTDTRGTCLFIEPEKKILASGDLFAMT